MSQTTVTVGGLCAWTHPAPGGSFHTFDRFQVAGEGDSPRRIHILLPSGYDAGRRYATVYMNDGGTVFFPGGPADQSWRAAEVLSALVADGRVPPLIVVGVCPVDRDREYADPAAGLDEYARYLAEHVRPFVERNYRTLPGPAATAVVGSSHGGLAAFYAAVQRPDVFGFAGALSPSFWRGVDDDERFPAIRPTRNALKGSWITRGLDQLVGGARPRVYVDWGLVRTGGPHNSSIEERAAARGREMVDLLAGEYGYRRGDDLFEVEDPDGEHDENTWHRRVGRVFELFARTGVP